MFFILQSRYLVISIFRTKSAALWRYDYTVLHSKFIWADIFKDLIYTGESSLIFRIFGLDSSQEWVLSHLEFVLVDQLLLYIATNAKTKTYF